MADKKISELDPAAALSGSEEVPIVQSATTVRTTAQDIANLGAGGKITLTGNIDFYVATTGSNSNDGLTALTPWQTIQYAADFVARNYRNPNNYFVTINVAAGTYTETVYLGFNECGSGGILILGNTLVAFRDAAVPIIKNNSTSPIFIVHNGTWAVDGFVIGESAPANIPGSCMLVVGQGSFGSTYSCSFGKCSSAHLSATLGGTVESDYNEVFGTAPSYIRLREWAEGKHSHDPIVLSVDPGCANGFFFLERFCRLHFNTDNGGITGTSSGPRVFMDEFSYLHLDVAFSVIPGATDGTIGQDSIVSLGADIIRPSFVGDSGAGGKIGYVPAPATGDATKFLRGDATWATPSSSGTITVGTTPIASGTAGRVVYEDSGNKFGEASAFTISSGQPNVASGSKYLYNSLSALYGVAHATADNWFFAEAGNLTLSGYGNICAGPTAGDSLTTGFQNTLLGSNAGTAGTSMNGCVAMGVNALAASTDSVNCFALGAAAMGSGDHATDCVAIGANAMANFTTSFANNVAIGAGAMTGSSASGVRNTGIGPGALGALTAGHDNIGMGLNSLASVSSGDDNVCIGQSSGTSITTTDLNVAIGSSAYLNGTGTGNVCVGDVSGYGYGSGSYNYNISIGHRNGVGSTGSSSGNITIGGNPNDRVLFGSGGSCIVIGYDITVPDGAGTAAGQIAIGNLFFGTGATGTSTTAAGLAGILIPSPTAVLHLGASSTSRANLRFDPTSAAGPSSPNDGDMWYDGTNLKFRHGGTTSTIV